MNDDWIVQKKTSLGWMDVQRFETEDEAYKAMMEANVCGDFKGYELRVKASSIKTYLNLGRFDEASDGI
jgi:UDP-2,3-diacylglucosamine pyrophosphatase LpxH